MLLYRIESVKREGPFKDGSSGIDAYKWDSHPTPSDEGLPLQKGDICACASRAQLRYWFDRTTRRELKKKKFVICVYKVDPAHVRLGSKQVTFDPKNAERHPHRLIRC